MWVGRSHRGSHRLGPRRDPGRSRRCPRWRRQIRESSRGPPGRYPVPGSTGRRKTDPVPSVQAAGSASLAVGPVLVAVRTVLANGEPVRIVAPVLLGDVVAVLALLARQGDLGPNISGGHGCLSLAELSSNICSGVRCGQHCRAELIVAVAGLEPATKRL